jgi:hypothetical protein
MKAKKFKIVATHVVSGGKYHFTLDDIDTVEEYGDTYAVVNTIEGKEIKTFDFGQYSFSLEVKQ